jgi:hypothetical protein
MTGQGSRGSIGLLIGVIGVLFGFAFRCLEYPPSYVASVVYAPFPFAELLALVCVVVARGVRDPLRKPLPLLLAFTVASLALYLDTTFQWALRDGFFSSPTSLKFPQTHGFEAVIKCASKLWLPYLVMGCQIVAAIANWPSSGHHNSEPG